MKVTNISSHSLKAFFIEMCFNDTTLATGTAFCVETAKGPAIITNRHNVTGRHQDNDKPLSSTGGIPNEIIVHSPGTNSNTTFQQTIPLEKNDTPVWIEHPYLGRIADFILIPISHPTVPLQTYKLGPTGQDFHLKIGKNTSTNNGDIPIRIRPSDRVSVIGFPFGLRIAGQLPVWANGFVASEPDVDYEELPIFLIDCRARQGQSGSPVIININSGLTPLENSNLAQAVFTTPVSRFLGIYSGRINSESDLGRVWKATAIKELVAHYESLSAL